MPTLLEILKKSTAFLERKGLETPRLDAEVLIAHGLGLRRLDLYLQHDRPLSEAELARLRDLLAERGAGKPVAYLTGTREFFGLAFEVTGDVLVPRPETEGLVEAGVAALSSLDAPLFCDVGTGSGCVAVAVLHAVSRARAWATDVSEAALAVAARNARRHGVEGRLTLVHGHLLDPFRGTEAWGRLDAVLSNPPYVVRGDPTLAADVAKFEPAAALYVEGDDPLSVAREIATTAREALRPGGLLALEVGAASGTPAREALARLGYVDVSLAKDLGGIERVVSGRCPPAAS